jgi:nucleotide-binding universal stress UspA family protein
VQYAGVILDQKGTSGMYQHILIATDGSQAAEKAVSHGVELARLCSARVTAVAVHAPFRVIAVAPEVIVATPPDYATTAKADADEDLRRVAKVAAAAGVPCETLAIEHEQPPVAIVEAAKSRGCDLIVIPSRGRRGVTALVLGSLTMEVVSHATVPVLVLR